MNVYGLAYQFVHSPPLDGAAAFEISACYCASYDNGRGYIRLPQNWAFEVALTEVSTTRSFGASETRGLFGGMENEPRKVYSDTCERAIGDVLTAKLCEIADFETDYENTAVLILGPALPKIAGRFAALHLPSELAILFICPRPFPRWIAEQVDEASVLPPCSSGPPTEEGWENEPLIVGYEYGSGGGASTVIQQISTYRQRLLEPQLLRWCGTKLGANLPCELVVAAGHVANHRDQPYLDSSQKLRAIKALTSAKLYDVPREAMPSRSETPGWEIEWTAPSPS